MLGNLFGQFIGGVIWGVGATVASSFMSGGNPEALRDVAKMAVKTYLTATDRVMEAGDEVRRSFESIVAEVETERTTTPELQG
jgi:hypothetical protein